MTNLREMTARLHAYRECPAHDCLEREATLVRTVQVLNGRDNYDGATTLVQISSSATLA